MPQVDEGVLVGERRSAKRRERRVSLSLDASDGLNEEDTGSDCKKAGRQHIVPARWRATHAHEQRNGLSDAHDRFVFSTAATAAAT
jgi:hypothetical protein